MKKSIWFLSGLLSSALFFCQVQVYHGHTLLFGARYAMAAYNPAWITGVDSANLLVSGNWSNYPYVNLTSYVLGKNKGGGIVYLNSTDTTSAQNACTIFVDAAGNRFYRELTGPMTSSQCGAIGDNVADDTSALQAGLNVIANGPVVNMIQGAQGGEFLVDPGTFKITASLNFGSSSLNNNGAKFIGSGRGSTVIVGPTSGSLCTINYNTFDASSTLSDMFLVNNGGAGSCGVSVTGNGQVIERLWLDAVSGIQFDGASDVQISDILCDQCNATVINFRNTVAVSANINIQGVEAFGGTSQPFAGGIGCVGAHHDIVVSGFVTNFLGGSSVIMSGGCQMTVDAYNLNSFNNTAAGAPSTQYGVTVSGSGTKLTLGTGVIAGMQAAGIEADSGAVVIDNGATVFNNVHSTSAHVRAPVDLTEASYFKTGGSIAGGTGLDIELVNMLANGDGFLTLTGVALSNAADFGVVVQGTVSPVSAVSIVGCNFNGMNALNNPANTPIAITGSGVVAGNIADNIIGTGNAVTAAVTVSAGTVNITNNLAHSGTFPGTAGGIVSTNNRNY